MSDAGPEPRARKAELRRTQRERLRSVDAEAVRAESAAACRVLLESGLFDVGTPAGTVAGYLPLPVERGAEADAWTALDVLRGRSADVAIPHIDWASGKFGLRRVPGGSFWDDLERDRHGLRKAPVDWPMVRVEEVGAVIVPGLAFDGRGGRLGRGAGMYDRFLRDLPSTVPAVGLAIRAQIVDDVPMDGHDIRLTATAGPDGLLRAT
ncbi:MAG: 5-formyltetrahydrofolate cyclo-ligase [Planctomycetota bacterium]